MVERNREKERRKKIGEKKIEMKLMISSEREKSVINDIIWHLQMMCNPMKNKKAKEILAIRQHDEP